MDKKINSGMIEKIAAVKFNSVTIDKDGERVTLSPKETKEYIKKFVFGGKSLGQLEKQLIKDGIKGTAWETRKKIMKMFEDLLDDKLASGDREELMSEIENDKDAD